MESNYNLLSENQFGEVVVFAPLIRVPRNATSCPCVSCQESKTFSCYSTGGGVLIPLAEETVGAGPIVPSAILSSLDSQLPSGPLFLPALPCVLPGQTPRPHSLPCCCPSNPGNPQAFSSLELPIISYFLFAQSQIVITSKGQ